MKPIKVKLELERIEQVLHVCKRLGVKPSLMLKRYHHALQMLKLWQGKGKLAEGKLKKYGKVARYYERKTNIEN